MALPTDLGSDDEPEFRNQIRELASDVCSVAIVFFYK